MGNYSHHTPSAQSPQQVVPQYTENKPRISPPEEEIDLIDLIGSFWKDRYLIAKIIGGFLVVGILVALLSPVEYETEVVVLPELTSNESGASSLLQRYGGMLGISGANNSSNNNTIPPQLYPQIIESIPFQVDLMNTQVTFQEYDTTVTVSSFFQNVYKPSALSYVKGYTIGLPGKVIGGIAGLFSEEQEQGLQVDEYLQKLNPESIYELNKNQQSVFNILKERISISQNQESGVVTLSVEMPDPRAAAEVGRMALQLLKEYVRDYRTQKVTSDLNFIQQQVAQAKQQFEESQKQLSEFRDRNINLTSARAQSREQELQSQYDLAFNTYNSLRQQREEAKITVQKSTPVFSILQPVKQPLIKSQPNKKLIFIVFFIFGGGIGLACSLVKYSGIIQELKKI